MMKMTTAVFNDPTEEIGVATPSEKAVSKGTQYATVLPLMQDKNHQSGPWSRVDHAKIKQFSAKLDYICAWMEANQTALMEEGKITPQQEIVDKKHWKFEALNSALSMLGKWTKERDEELGTPRLG